MASGPDLTIISATRHEADNVETLLERITAALEPTGITWRLVFVDDSDDNTPLVIRSLADRYPVSMLHRPAGHRRGGLSGALTLGIRSVDTPVYAVIDADLQHPPELLPALVQPILAGEADVVAGSRYVEGGSASGLTGTYRRLVSRGSILVVQVMFPRLRAIKDSGGNFFAVRTSVTGDTELRPEGFKMLVEILVRGNWDTIVEIPYDFAGRAEGKSKVTLKVGVYFLRHVGRLWLETTGPAWARRFGRPNPAHPDGPVLLIDDPAFAESSSA